MAKKKDDGKYRGHFEVPPKARGGRRRQKPISESQSRALAAGRNKSWTPGCVSPNPTGRPRAHKESVDFLRGHDDEINAYIVALARKGAEGKLTNSDKIWSQHLWAMKEYMFGRNPQAIVVGGGLDLGDLASVDGTGVKALLLRARMDQAKKSVAIEAKPGVFVADASGNIAAPAPEPAPVPDPEPAPKLDTVTNLPPEPEAAAAPPKAPPLRIVEPDPAPAKPKAKKAPSHPAASQFAGFNEFLSEKASREQFNDLAKRQEEARRQGRPGGQIPLSELQPDPQPRQEFVNFTLAGNGQIKRC